MQILTESILEAIERNSRPRLWEAHQRRIDINRNIKYLADHKPCPICGAHYDSNGRYENCVGPIPDNILILAEEIRSLWNLNGFDGKG